MNAFAAFLDEPETSLLKPVPRFPVQAPDGCSRAPEIDRQVALFRDMHMLAPAVFGFAIPNAGKRNPTLARKEGICGGAFDTEWNWKADDRARTAWIELKGYDARGRAGELSRAQIDWGNRMHDMGHPVACFFTAWRAIDWLRDIGAPVAWWPQ